MKKLPLPKSMAVRKCLSRVAAHSNRPYLNGGQPIAGLLTLAGKAERLPRGHAFRLRVAGILRKRKAVLHGRP